MCICIFVMPRVCMCVCVRVRLHSEFIFRCVEATASVEAVLAKVSFVTHRMYIVTHASLIPPHQRGQNSAARHSETPYPQLPF